VRPRVYDGRMLTRREFLAGSSTLLVAAQLPQPIASLPSMKTRATPITADERRARVEKARRLMARHKIDAIMLTQGTSLTYFTGMRWGGGERLTACVVPAKGEPFFVCPAFEEDRAREQIALGPFAGGTAASPRACATAASPPAGSGSRRRPSTCGATASPGRRRS